MRIFVSNVLNNEAIVAAPPSIKFMAFKNRTSLWRRGRNLEESEQTEQLFMIRMMEHQLFVPCVSQTAAKWKCHMTEVPWRHIVSRQIANYSSWTLRTSWAEVESCGFKIYKSELWHQRCCFNLVGQIGPNKSIALQTTLETDV